MITVLTLVFGLFKGWLVCFPQMNLKMFLESYLNSGLSPRLEYKCLREALLLTGTQTFPQPTKDLCRKLHLRDVGGCFGDSFFIFHTVISSSLNCITLLASQASPEQQRGKAQHLSNIKEECLSPEEPSMGEELGGEQRNQNELCNKTQFNALLSVWLGAALLV